MRTLAIGLTGGIASGKSLAAAEFAALGIPVLDADQVSRMVVAPPSAALAQIADAFGPQFLAADGGLDRQRMREHIFASPAERLRLEAILHPPIYRELKHWRDAQPPPYCILSVAILLESGMRALVDRVLVVDAPVAAQRARLLARDGITPALAEGLLAAQATREERLAAASEVIDNSATPADLRRQVAALHDFYLKLAQERRLK